ncbi:hypothetical protein [Arthrobacter psychrolactophilus]
MTRAIRAADDNTHASGDGASGGRAVRRGKFLAGGVNGAQARGYSLRVGLSDDGAVAERSDDARVRRALYAENLRDLSVGKCGVIQEQGVAGLGEE